MSAHLAFDAVAEQNDANFIGELIAKTHQILVENKAENIVQIDLRGRSSMADAILIASGRSSRQVGAIADKLVRELKAEFGLSVQVEGKDNGEWVLIDTGDVIIHLFHPETREFYQLEKLWEPVASGLLS